MIKTTPFQDVLHAWMKTSAEIGRSGDYDKCVELIQKMPIAPPSEEGRYDINLDCIMSGAIEKGHMKIVNLLLDNDCKNYDFMLIHGLIWNQDDVCDLAVKFGAKAKANLLRYATTAQNEKYCTLAKQNGATDFDGMMENAATNDSVDMCTLARKWGGSTHVMMYHAAINGRIEICKLAKFFGETDFKMMAECGKSRNNNVIVALAEQWQYEKNCAPMILD